MDAQTIINIAIGLVGALGGWVLNNLKTSEASTYYKGWSNTASTSTATWKILKGIEISLNNYVETWSDGNELLDNIWDKRLSLSYS